MRSRPAYWDPSASATAWSSDADGLILTIGYLVTEAADVWLTTPDGRELAAHPWPTIR